MSGKGPNCTEACTGEQCDCGDSCKCGEGCNCPSCKTCKCSAEDCKCDAGSKGTGNCKC
nr:metallothionein allelic variant 1 [Lymnaea stagnalis]